MKVFDYLLIRTPKAKAARLGDGDKDKDERRSQPGEVSGSRIFFSLFGILLGIGLSFVVVGLEVQPATPSANAGQADGAEVGQDGTQDDVRASDTSQRLTPRIGINFSWGRLLTVGIISIVICGLTYQGLYFSLRLYNNEPAWLVLFVSFQYGYFWQSAVEGARVVFAGIGSG